MDANTLAKLHYEGPWRKYEPSEAEIDLFLKDANGKWGLERLSLYLMKALYTKEDAKDLFQKVVVDAFISHFHTFPKSRHELVEETEKLKPSRKLRFSSTELWTMHQLVARCLPRCRNHRDEIASMVMINLFTELRNGKTIDLDGGMITEVNDEFVIYFNAPSDPPPREVMSESATRRKVA